MSAERLLIIDDEPDICAFVKEVAEGMGFEVEATSDPEQFKALHDSFGPTTILMDLVMPEVDGIELLRYLAGRKTTARIMVMSGYSEKYLDSAQSLGQAFGLGGVRVLSKPIRLAVLREALATSEPA